MPVSTSLTLRALLKTAAGRGGFGTPGGLVSGLSPSAKAFYVAAAAAHDPRDVVAVLLVPTDADVEALTADLRFFAAGLEGLADLDVERVVLPCPSHEVDPYRGLAPHLSVASARARALHGLASRRARVIVTSAAAILPRVAAPQRLLAAAIELVTGFDIDPHDLGDLLVDAGFTREDPVDEHGEFCIRGGVVDLFPAGDAQPVRLEFVGDTIESIRRYDPATQRSVATIDQVLVLPLREVFDARDASAPPPSPHSPPPALVSFFDYLTHGRRPLLFVSEEQEVRDQIDRSLDQIGASYADLASQENVVPPSALLLERADVDQHLGSATRLETLFVEDVGSEPSPASRLSPPASPRHISCQLTPSFNGRLPEWIDDIRRARERGDSVLFVAQTPGRAERTVELLKEYDVPAAPIEHADEAHSSAVLVTTGLLARGFRLPGAALQLYAEADIFEEEQRRAPERRRSLARTFLSDFRDLKVGDLIVHVDHGIGVFVGLKQIAVGVGDDVQEFLEVHYAGDDKLFVPVERLDLVQKYSGAARPPLDRLGGTTWERAKTRVKKAMRDMAEELLKLYAARKANPGHAFGPDTHWQEEFDSAFEYELTPDQQAAITDIRRDLESPTPMDRLLCGDVGYGKTEVAMRAAFKAVIEGKQVAFLAPTTVLAFQHRKTLGERFAGFPVRIDMVSRFRTKAEQKQTLADLAAGRVDIIVGTHRLLSKDVVFRDLGFLVVDEEQRFGVAHKERIKHLRKKVDVLTMSATPIPRTLNMSLVGIRDMSIIETPPKDRLSIQTNVVKFDQRVIARAVRNELERNGQVYFVHNRVESIYSIGNLITRLVPEARVVIGHGQMSEEALERAMVDFVAHKYDILLATTIVENGLDIPNVNTILINRADRYGLSQLYQLRGRVGRSDRPAYAYLLIPPEESLSPIARKRLAAIKEFSDLGSGFRVAALDLEIRGAGNLLGGEQSGHIETVGFEMYMKLLEQAVRELKGEEIEDDVRAAVSLGVDLRIDEDYVSDMAQRLMLYRKVAAARREDELERTLDEIRDRYGPMPDSVLNLADYGRIRIMADRLGLESIDRQGPLVVLKFRADPGSRAPDPGRLVAVVHDRADVALAPPATLKLDLKKRMGVGDLGLGKKPKPGSGSAPKGRTPSPHPLRPTPHAPSWWTARATAGAVQPGFTKEEILKPVKPDPRGPDGVFTRVGGLLADLLGIS
jgi:transcription-repair coupling factor (superfamily II helicase)